MSKMTPEIILAVAYHVADSKAAWLARGMSMRRPAVGE
jgi:hypothetical protein